MRTELSTGCKYRVLQHKSSRICVQNNEKTNEVFSLNLKDIKHKILFLLTDERSAYCDLRLPSLDIAELRRRLLAILLDKHCGWEIPKEELEAIADVILPGIIKFFSTEEGRAEFEAWKKEQEQQEKNETEE